MKTILALLFALPAAAHDGEEHAAASSAEFLRVGVSARAAAMGEAYSAHADEASALFWNPAALTRLEKRSATFMHAGYLESSTLDYGAYGQRVSRHHAVGISFHYMTAGKITATDSLSAETGDDYTPHDMAVTFGYAYEFSEDLLSGWSAGGAVKYVRSQVVDSASTLAGDIGVLSPAIKGRVRLGLSLANMGGGLKYGEQTEPLPLTARLGSSVKLSPKWWATLDAVKARDEEPFVGAGTEYLISQGRTWSLAGRLGFNSRHAGDLEGVTGVAAGVGVGFKALSVDYALAPFGEVGTAHRASLTMRF